MQMHLKECCNILHFFKTQVLSYCFTANKKLITDTCTFDVSIVKAEKKIIKVLFHLTSKIALLIWISRVLPHAFPPKSLEYGVMDCWFFNIFYVLCKFWKCKIRCFSVFMTLWTFTSSVFEGDKIRIYIFRRCRYTSVLG